MKCPRCRSATVARKVLKGRVLVSCDTCPACGSLWLDGEVARRLSPRMPLEPCAHEKSKTQHRAPRRCPRCPDSPLDKMQLAGQEPFLLERCPQCGGLWLDGREIGVAEAEEYRRPVPATAGGLARFVNDTYAPLWRKRIHGRNVETDFSLEPLPLRDGQWHSPTQHRCPAGDAELSRYRACGIELEGCLSCKGIWADAGELDKLAGRLGAAAWRALRWPSPGQDPLETLNAILSGRPCPACADSQLVAVGFEGSPVVADRCCACAGVWADKAELDALVRLAKDAFSGALRDRDRARLFEQIRDVWHGPAERTEAIVHAVANIAALLSLHALSQPPLAGALAEFHSAACDNGL